MQGLAHGFDLSLQAENFLKVSTQAQLDPLRASMREFLLPRCSIEQTPMTADTLLLVETACRGDTSQWCVLTYPVPLILQGPTDASCT